MRKNVLFFLGAVTGAGLMLLATSPEGTLSLAFAKQSVGADPYSQLNLFGEVFERVRADYVESPTTPS